MNVQIAKEDLFNQKELDDISDDVLFEQATVEMEKQTEMKKGEIFDDKIIKIYNKKLNKYWECSYSTFLRNWSNYGWIIVK